MAIAFSSVVDSTFLLKKWHDVLGESGDRSDGTVLLFSKRELEEAKAFCKKKASNILSAGVKKNYRSKDFPIIRRTALFIFANMNCLKKSEYCKENNIKYVAEGSNMDDNGDYRPGL